MYSGVCLISFYKVKQLFADCSLVHRQKPNRPENNMYFVEYCTDVLNPDCSGSIDPFLSRIEAIAITELSEDKFTVRLRCWLYDSADSTEEMDYMLFEYRKIYNLRPDLQIGNYMLFLHYYIVYV